MFSKPHESATSNRVAEMVIISLEKVEKDARLYWVTLQRYFNTSVHMRKKFFTVPCCIVHIAAGSSKTASNGFCTDIIRRAVQVSATASWRSPGAEGWKGELSGKASSTSGGASRYGLHGPEVERDQSTLNPC